MIQLWLTNDQAAAVLPELREARERTADKSRALLQTERDAKQEERLTRSLTVLGALVGRITTHHARCAAREPKVLPFPTHVLDEAPDGTLILSGDDR